MALLHRVQVRSCTVEPAARRSRQRDQSAAAASCDPQPPFPTRALLRVAAPLGAFLWSCALLVLLLPSLGGLTVMGAKSAAATSDPSSSSASRDKAAAAGSYSARPLVPSLDDAPVIMIDGDVDPEMIRQMILSGQVAAASAGGRGPPLQQPTMYPGGMPSSQVLSALPSASSLLLVSLSLRGHLVPLTRLAGELLDRGYKVSIAVQEDGRQYVNQTGARFLSLGRLPYSKASRREKLKSLCHDSSFFRGSLGLLQDIYLPNAAPMYKSLHSLVAKDKPTLMVIDAAALGAIDVAHHFRIPYIINHAAMPMRLEHEPHFAASPATSSAAPSLLTRAVDYLYPRLLAVALTPTLMDINRLRWAHELPLFHAPAHVLESGIPTQLEAHEREWTEQDQIREKTWREHMTLSPQSYADSLQPPAHTACESLTHGPAAILINTVVGFEHAYPLPQGVHLTGPLMPNTAVEESRKATEGAQRGAPWSSIVSSAGLVPSVPASLSSWLDKSTKPVIAVLFGAGTMSYLEAWQVKSLAAGLTDSRFRVLWALRTDGKHALGANLPNSFRIKNNFQLLPVLQHPQVRLVISACGAATVQETLYWGKPLLCIPLFADQLDVSVRVVESGAGLRLDKWHLEVSDISKHVLNLVRNHTFRNQAKRMGKIIRAAGGTKQAADIVADTIKRHKFKLLQQPEQLTCWHQVYQLDLALFLFALALLALLAIRFVFVLLISCIASVKKKQRANAAAAGGAEANDKQDTQQPSLSWKQVRSVDSALRYLSQWLHADSSRSSASSPSSSDANGASSLSNGHRPLFPLSAPTSSDSVRDRSASTDSNLSDAQSADRRRMSAASTESDDDADSDTQHTHSGSSSRSSSK